MLAVLLAPFYILVNIYVVRWMFRWMGLCHHIFTSRFFQIGFVTVYLVFATTLLTSFCIQKPASLHRVLKNISNYFLGTFLYILLVIVILDAGRLIFRHMLKMQWTYSPRAFLISGSVCILLVVSLSVYGIFHQKQLFVTPYDIHISKTVKGIDSIKIVLIADTHFGCSISSAYAEKMTEAINKEEPDVVCFAGDFFDNDFDDIAQPLEMQKQLLNIEASYGVYGCWGNHDINEPILAGFTFHQDKNSLNDKRMKEFLEASNITLLEDEAVLIDDAFYLVGRKDKSRSEKLEETRLSPSQLTSSLDKDKPIIFIDHQPSELLEKARAGVDLDLGGHTHDGQLFPGNLITRLFWENSYGHYKKEQMHSIVTSGLGIWGPNMRVGTKSEICSITVHFENS